MKRHRRGPIRNSSAQLQPIPGSMKPDPKFSYIRADEVAECWDGVNPWLYSILWEKIVPLQSAIPNLEDSGPSDHVGHASLAKYWHHLPVEAQLLLNSLARRNG